MYYSVHRYQLEGFLHQKTVGIVAAMAAATAVAAAICDAVAVRAEGGLVFGTVATVLIPSKVMGLQVGAMNNKVVFKKTITLSWVLAKVVAKAVVSVAEDCNGYRRSGFPTIAKRRRLLMIGAIIV